MANRYGRENVISAYVHLDETSPHIHFAFIPVTADKKKGGYKVSAKEVISKHELQVFHQELSKHLEKALGHSIGILNGETKDGNKSIAELKEKSALERADRAEKEAVQKEKELDRVNEKLSKTLNYLPKKSSEMLNDKCEEIIQEFNDIKSPIIPKSTAQKYLNDIAKQANTAIKQLDKTERTNYSLRSVNVDGQKANKKLQTENDQLRGENAELRQELSAAHQRENAVRNLGLSDIVSAEVQRQTKAEEEKKRSRQGELP